MEDVTKRESLAALRTKLANERTLMSYIRTALALIALGSFLIKYDPNIYTLIIGVLGINAGIIIIIYGFYRFYLVKNNLGSL